MLTDPEDGHDERDHVEVLARGLAAVGHGELHGHQKGESHHPVRLIERGRVAVELEAVPVLPYPYIDT